MLQRRRKQRHQHGEAVTIDLGNDGDQVLQDLPPLPFVALHQRADVERHAHVVETDPVQFVEIEQRQRRLRARIRRIGIGLCLASPRRRWKLEKFDQGCAAPECRLAALRDRGETSETAGNN